MFADTSAIRDRAATLRVRADEIRVEAGRLVARTDAVAWEGTAADALRDHVRGRAAALIRTAVLHDQAAEALDRHASTVDSAVALAADLADKAIEVAHDAQETVRGWVR